METALSKLAACVKRQEALCHVNIIIINYFSEFFTFTSTAHVICFDFLYYFVYSLLLHVHICFLLSL